MSDTLDRLREILVRDYKLEPSQVTGDATLETLGLDSLAVAELLFNVEDVFGIKLPMEPLQLTTVDDVVGAIDALVAARGSGVTTPAA